MTHGFDNYGSQYDGNGNLKNWWTASEKKKFQARSKCVEKQFSSYLVPGSKTQHVDGKLTLGENIADLGGLHVAYAAYSSLNSGGVGVMSDDAKEFFYSYAYSWCGHATPESDLLQANTDPHSPNEYRVNGPLSNLSPFREAFGCKAGDAMVGSGAGQCSVW